MLEERVIWDCISVYEVHACMICAFLCEVLKITLMSVVEMSDVEVAVKKMMMMMCVVKKDDEEEDFRNCRWLRLAG